MDQALVSKTNTPTTWSCLVGPLETMFFLSLLRLVLLLAPPFWGKTVVVCVMVLQAVLLPLLFYMQDDQSAFADVRWIALMGFSAIVAATLVFPEAAMFSMGYWGAPPALALFGGALLSPLLHPKKPRDQWLEKMGESFKHRWFVLALTLAPSAVGEGVWVALGFGFGWALLIPACGFGVSVFVAGCFTWNHDFEISAPGG